MNKDKEIPKFFTFTKFAEKNRERGTWPFSAGILYRLHREASYNGFGKAFLRIGKRLLVDEEKFWEAVIQSRETNNE